MDDVKQLIADEIPRLRRYALALVNDPVAADDLVQDCIERGIRKRHLWSRRGSVRSWLYRILYNVFINQSAKRQRVQNEVELDALLHPPSSASEQEGKIIFREIAQAMQSLPPDQRAAIALTALEGLSYDEAASVMGVPIGTLRSRLHRGRETLRSVYVGDFPKLRQVK